VTDLHKIMHFVYEGIKAIQPDPTDASIDILPRISVLFYLQQS
jgi:hypothetical protein